MHLPAAGYDVRTIQELLGHKGVSISTIMIYTHVLNKGGHVVQSPVDGLQAVYTDCVIIVR
ncbi:MAG: tyrosine-type recombinase/integrase [Planctomycetia bacterium]|nr:tyrosine-type recombinase/integrase [Planctomycetia bacterium]MDG6004382.1 hypothetical protein [Candidatus Brocadia sp.]GJQ24384.1 MAG: hypothetical protein HBSAPP01_21740 [Candidatus Brocadia sapporoensis]